MPGLAGAGLAAQRVRLSRPTNQLTELLRFYCTGLGLGMLLSFERDDAGYGGVVLGGPGLGVHLEFTTHPDGFPIVSPPTEENLLVFYLDAPGAVESLTGRLAELGYLPVPARNPHWDQDGVTFKDPDGWPVVLMRRRNV